RIAVNDELRNLQQALNSSGKVLNFGGRLDVISFHSLEDRIVKNFFKRSDFKIINKKPIIPSEDEKRQNPRSRSAKLRIGEKIKNGKKKNL
ncbi:16S rRNA (cytosine(1402)-N(4))-methyltransferase, partial [bacterium CG1_02_42_9]